VSPARDGSREATRPRVVRPIPGSRYGRLPYAAAALFIAVLLWAVVRGDQVIERTIYLPLVPALDTGLRLDGDRPEVRVRVSGRARELLKLGRASPLRTDATAAGVGPVRLDLRPGTVELPDGVDATVKDVRPHALTVRIARDEPESSGKSPKATNSTRRP
jgi:hypothetical protein